MRSRRQDALVAEENTQVMEMRAWIKFLTSRFGHVEMALAAMAEAVELPSCSDDDKGSQDGESLRRRSCRST